MGPAVQRNGHSPHCPLQTLQHCDASFRPAHEMWASRGLLPGGAMRRKGASGGGGINRRKQGGEDYLAQVGALAVPEHARQRNQQRGPGGVLSQVCREPQHLLSCLGSC